MTILKASICRWIGFSLYWSLLIVVLLYVRFPEEKFKIFCQRNIEYFLPDIGCQLDGLKYIFPATLRIGHAEIVNKNGKYSSVLRVENIIISPSLKSFGKKLRISGELFSGSFNGDLMINSDEETFHLANFLMQGVKLEEISWLQERLSRNVLGKMKLQGDFGYSKKGQTGLYGEGNVEIQSGKIDLFQPVLLHNALLFDQIMFEVTVEDGDMELLNGSLKGIELTANFAGEIASKPQQQSHEVMVTGNAELHPAMWKDKPDLFEMVKRLQYQFENTPLPFKIAGTLDNPKFGFSH